MSDELTIMFGEHKGKYIHELPSEYLKWLAENCDWDVQVQEEADEEYQFRERNNTHRWND